LIFASPARGVSLWWLLFCSSPFSRRIETLQDNEERTPLAFGIKLVLQSSKTFDVAHNLKRSTLMAFVLTFVGRVDIDKFELAPGGTRNFFRNSMIASLPLQTCGGDRM
jgi:hypothetical protein